MHDALRQHEKEIRFGIDMNDNEIIEGLVRYFEISGLGIPEKDDDLFLGGLLDSFGTIEFLEHIESVFPVRIGPDEVSLEKFRTISLVRDLIKQKIS